MAAQRKTFSSTNGDQKARRRLLKAAVRLFADAGLEATSVRELAREARVNIAAVNYYFGSKENLYLEVFREQCRKMRQRNRDFEVLVQQGGRPLTAVEAAEAIRRFIAATMDSLLGSRESERLFGLMLREMSQPTAAMEMVLSEIVGPRHRTLVSLIEKVCPALTGRPEATLHALSIIGQCLYYRLCSPVALRLIKRRSMTPSLVEALAQHIADFSLRALERAGDETRRGTRRTRSTRRSMPAAV
jgi:TetR/AcrR family transcriptional regulator, regulator of cefoperazone and chloramphenicol sensitivity